LEFNFEEKCVFEISEIKNPSKLTIYTGSSFRTGSRAPFGSLPSISPAKDSSHKFHETPFVIDISFRKRNITIGNIGFNANSTRQCIALILSVPCCSGNVRKYHVS